MSMEPKKTVLIVEDEVNIVDIVRFNLQREGYATLEAYDGEAGLAMAREKKPDLIHLDEMMPKMMGFDVCRALRAEGDNVPVIILTAREEEEDKILGLEIGADDYITKPFSMRELLARIKANLRRTTMLSVPAAEDNSMSAGGGITINTPNAAMVDELAPLPDEIVVNKTTDSVSLGTNYTQLLQNMGIDTVIVTGVVTDQCVAGTIRVLADQGFRIYCPEDCCAAGSKELHEQELRIIDMLAAGRGRDAALYIENIYHHYCDAHADA